MQKIIIIGGKGGAVTVSEHINHASEQGADVKFLGWAFDDESFGSEISGFPILGKTKEIYSKYQQDEDVKFLFQIWRPDLMAERAELLNSYGIPDNRWATFVHPSCIVAKTASIGNGTAIMANCVINSNAQIGNHCTIHSNSLIGHDTSLMHYNFIAAHCVFGSNTIIGNSNFFGLNSTFNNKISIGSNCFVGMASNVIKGIPDGVKVYGNPAKPFQAAVRPL